MDATRAEHVLQKAIAQADRRQRRYAFSVWGGRVGLVLGLLAVWQLASGTLVDEEFISRPSDIAQAWWAMLANGTLASESRYTVAEFLIGYLVGGGLGVLSAGLLTVRDIHYRILEPYFFVLFSIPKLALAPLFGLWFGLGVAPKIVLAALVTYLLVLMNTVAGMRSVNRQTLAMLQMMGATRLQTYRQLIVPHALPFVVTALRLAIPLAMVAVILAEFLGSMAGLGHVIAEQSTFLAVDNMMALVVTLAVFVMVLRLLLWPLERWVNRHQLKATGVKS
jgi:NitT/TauT family transport system permease protein